MSVQAEIYKLALPSNAGMKFYWWPILPNVTGWHHDRDHSIHYSANTQAPDGYTFANAETVIYARAIFKPRVPNLNDIASFIENDQVKFKSDGNIIVSETTAVFTSDNTELKSFTFSPTKTGNWEQVAYGEEEEYYLIFTISSRSKDGFNKSSSFYEQFINNYKK